MLDLSYSKHPTTYLLALTTALIGLSTWLFTDGSAAADRHHPPTGVTLAERVAAPGANGLTDAGQPAEVRADDTWTPTSTTGAPSARSGHTAVWTGTEMIVWGGAPDGSGFRVNTGGRYNPATDTWTPTSTINAPGAVDHAVWTGTEMIVWGGISPSGGRYTPATDTWRRTSTFNVRPQVGSTTPAIWTGTEMIVWGSDLITVSTGERYTPATDTWRRISTINAPSAIGNHTAIWTGTEMIVSGGYVDFDEGPIHTGGRYDPATDTWRPISTINAPSGGDRTAVWTGTEMIVWGGLSGTGGHYNPATDTWRPTSTINAPSGRKYYTAIWTGMEMIVWGGSPDSRTFLDTGGRYDPASSNPIDDPQFFVRQHYLDFLNREPDPAGLAFWTNEITSCGFGPQCTESKRINVSVAFFISIEFQETGYLVYRMYKAAYGDMPGTPVPLTRQDFLPDTQRVGQGVVVNTPGWEQALENNKNAFANEFVARSRFTTAFPQGMTAEEFVDALNANAGGALSQDERNQLVSDLASGAKTRAQVLRSVAEDADLAQAEFNKAFVLMQYFGYLRRNPNDQPDADFAGYDFWLNKLNQFNGNFVESEMVKSFISSDEYRQRFGQSP